MSAGVVSFGGSRSLPVSFFWLVLRVVFGVLSSGCSVCVGCAVGADALVVRAVLRAGAAARLRVFAVGSVSGWGFWRGSALGSVRAAAAAGAAVSWGSGGSSGSLRARLALRSARCVGWAARARCAGSRSCGAVFFVVGGPAVSPGSWGSLVWAARASLPVVVFPCGVGASCLPSSLPVVGSVGWVPAGPGVWALGWRLVVGG